MQKTEFHGKWVTFFLKQGLRKLNGSTKKNFGKQGLPGQCETIKDTSFLQNKIERFSSNEFSAESVLIEKNKHNNLDNNDKTNDITDNNEGNNDKTKNKDHFKFSVFLLCGRKISTWFHHDIPTLNFR